MRVAITNADGSVAIMSLIAAGEWDDKRIADEVERSGLPSQPILWRRIDDGDLPTDRSFRGAWSDNGKAIVHDMPKARDIQRERIRALRAPLLAGLDAEYQRADEAEDKAAKRAVALRKQALRDAPSDPRIDSADTIEQLKAITLEEQDNVATGTRASVRGG